ncbi:Ig-like domain-containing protein [Fictibacillus sp. NPDC058756]|uniref:Ig-like domain-containing protein n=1 Tax=Fictibacillus sp. NPDC058756 TaxID=3346625 RepID=UPI0036D0FF7D
MKRKFSSLFLMAVLMFSIFPFTSFANEDYPTYESLSVSPQEAKINEQVWFDLYAPDSAYFMLEARFTYLSPQGEERVIELSGPDHWTGQFTATSFDEVGTWQLQSIYLYDDSYNSSTFTREQIDQPENYDFTILNEVKEIDVTAPTVDAITFEKEQVQAGDFTKITVSASDDTGVEWITLGLYNTAGRGYDYVTDFVKTEDGTFEATWWVPQYTDPGEWKIDWVYAGDAAGNQYNWDDYMGDYPVSFGTIQVLNDNPDNTAPTVSSIQFSNGVVEAGQENTLQLEADDDLSGINNLSVELRNDFGQRLYIDGIYQSEDGFWTSNFVVPSYMKNSTFKVWNVYTQDNAGNVDHQFYEEEYPAEFGTFEVVNANEDTNAPVVQSVTFEKDSMVTEDTNVVRIAATDDNTGIESIEIFMKSPTGKGMTSSYLYPDEEGNFMGEFSIPPYTEPGEWRVSQIIARDFAGNVLDAAYTAENYPDTFGTFNVENTEFDFTPPTINKVIFQTPEVKGSEEAELTIFAEDSQTVPAFVEVELVSSSGQQVLTGNTDYLDESGLMHVTIPVPGDAEHGEWLVKQVKIIDIAGNEAVYTYSADDYPADFGKLFVNNDTVAPNAPLVDEVSDRDTMVKGTAEPLSTIAILVNGELLADGQAAEDGTFTVEIPVQKAGTVLEVTSTDAAGNRSEVATVTIADKTAPEAPVVTKVTKETVAGTAEAGSIVYVKDVDGNVMPSAAADEKGNFLVKIEKQKNHAVIYVSAVDLAGNESEKVEIIVKEAR